MRSQAATQDRVEALLRASHPSVAQLPNEISASTLAESCGVPIDPTKWGEEMEVISLSHTHTLSLSLSLRVEGS